LVSVDRSGGWSGQGGRQDEIVLRQIMNHAGGLPDMYNDLVRIITPRPQHTGYGMLLMAKHDREFLASSYADGEDGGLFKLELAYFPLTTVDGNPQSPKMPQPDDVIGFDLQDRGNDPEAYRWFYLKENHQDRDDFTQIIQLAKAFSLSGSALDSRSQELMDVNQWLRVFALKSLSGDADTYGFGYPHNQLFYFRPSDGKALTFPWDLDFAWTRSPSDALVGGANIARLIALPNNLRLYYAHLLDLINTSFHPAYAGRWTTHYAGLVGQNYSGVLNYITQRANYVRNQLPKEIPFRITTNNGQDFLVNAPRAALAGRGWLNIKDLYLAGSTAPLAVKWTGLTNWQITVPLLLGTNLLQVLARDARGELVASNQIMVTTTAATGAPDADGDGLPDNWETAHGASPLEPDADQDADQDGFSHRQEYLAGTDPQDPRSRLELGFTRLSASELKLSYAAQAGRGYTLQYRDSFTGGQWLDLAGQPAALTNRLIEAIAPVVGPPRARFYRLVLVPGQ
jgi:hypothetical protein